MIILKRKGPRSILEGNFNLCPQTPLRNTARFFLRSKQPNISFETTIDTPEENGIVEKTETEENVLPADLIDKPGPSLAQATLKKPTVDSLDDLVLTEGCFHMVESHTIKSSS
jgi:hypothetical protein